MLQGRGLEEGRTGGNRQFRGGLGQEEEGEGETREKD